MGRAWPSHSEESLGAASLLAARSAARNQNPTIALMRARGGQQSWSLEPCEELIAFSASAADMLAFSIFGDSLEVRQSAMQDVTAGLDGRQRFHRLRNSRAPRRALPDRNQDAAPAP